MDLSNSWARLARRTDNENAHAAARAAQKFLGPHSSLILEALHAGGAMGRYALSAATGIEPVAVGRRMAGLVQSGKVAVVKDAVEVTPSGRHGSVWTLRGDCD